MTRRKPRPIKSGFMGTKLRQQYFLNTPQLIPMHSPGWEALLLLQIGTCLLCKASFILLEFIKNVSRWFTWYASVLDLVEYISSYVSPCVDQWSLTFLQGQKGSRLKIKRGDQALARKGKTVAPSWSYWIVCLNIDKGISWSRTLFFNLCISAD